MSRRTLLRVLTVTVGSLTVIAGLIVLGLLVQPHVATWLGIGLLALGLISWAVRRWSDELIDIADAVVGIVASMLGSTSSTSPGGAISGALRTIGVIISTLAVIYLTHGRDLFKVTLGNLLFTVASLALLQQIMLNWLNPSPTVSMRSKLEEIARLSARSAKLQLLATGDLSPNHNRHPDPDSLYFDDYIDPRRREWLRRQREELERYNEEVERYEQYSKDNAREIDDRELRYRAHRPKRLREEVDREEREERERAVNVLRDRVTQVESMYYHPSFSRSLFRPLHSTKAAHINARITANHGLIIDDVWPRLELVIPRDTKNRLRREEFRISAYRPLATVLISVAIVGLLILSMHGSVTPSLVSICAGTLGMAGVIIVSMGRRVRVAYERRADTIELYRFDLVRAMRLPQPQSQAGFTVMAQVLACGVSDQSVEYAEVDSLGVNSAAIEFGGQRLDALRTELAREIPERVIQEVTNALQIEREIMLRRISPTKLENRDLESLASKIAERALPSISAVVREDFAKLARRMRDEMEASVANVVNGPALVNFTGYLVLESLPDIGDGTLKIDNGQITATAGSELGLLMTITPDEGAKTSGQERGGGDHHSFLALQPINIESGVSGTSVEFYAIVDSPTLTVYPHRSKLTVSANNKAPRVSVTTILPKGTGRHELWFQLYQFGHLIEVVAVAIEARAHSSSV